MASSVFDSKITLHHWYLDGRRDASSAYDDSDFDLDKLATEYAKSTEPDSAKALRAVAEKAFDAYWKEVEESDFKVWRLQVADSLDESIEDGLDPQKCYGSWKAGFRDAFLGYLSDSIAEDAEVLDDDEEEDEEEDDDEEGDDDE